METKKLILNADDFGLSKAHNKAVFEGFKAGLLTSASLLVNGGAYDDAVLNVIPKCPGLGTGVHLNIMEGKALTLCPFLINKEGYFNRSYLYLILNRHKKELLKQIEIEFRAQIEKALSDELVIDHLDSHVHTHSIPDIFKITCKLAKEYKIGAVRTQFEKPYLVPDFKKYSGLKYSVNLIKIGLLGYFTVLNRKTIRNFGLKTNDFIIGVGYTGMMDVSTVKYGLRRIGGEVAEALIHPCKYDREIQNSHVKEFEILKSIELKDEILKLGFSLDGYKNI